MLAYTGRSGVICLYDDFSLILLAFFDHHVASVYSTCVFQIKSHKWRYRGIEYRGMMPLMGGRPMSVVRSACDALYGVRR